MIEVKFELESVEKDEAQIAVSKIARFFNRPLTG
jgi:hypothetical protein